MRNICRTTQDAATGVHQWERFTTRGVPRKLHSVLAFTSYYLLNDLTRAKLNPTDKYSYFLRTTDMVRAKGISVNLRIQVQPNSGYKLRLLMFQGPYDMVDMSGGEGEEVLQDNMPSNPAEFARQGCYTPNGSIMTKFVKNDDDEIEYYAIKPGYTKLFGPQRPNLDSVVFQNQILYAKLNHPNVKVLFDRKVTFYNKKKKPKGYRYNKFFKTNTTWKFKETIYNGVNHQPDWDNDGPDCKMYFMIIATPLQGGVHDTGQDMHGFQLDDIQPGDQLDGQPIVQRRREGSVVSDAFGPPVAGPSDERMERVEEEPEDTAPRTRSKGKGRAPPPADVDDVQLRQGDDPQFRNALLNAWAIRRAEAARERADNPPPEPALPVGAVDEFGWSENQTILIKPTFRIWWVGMQRRVFVKTKRFQPRSRFRRK